MTDPIKKNDLMLAKAVYQDITSANATQQYDLPNELKDKIKVNENPNIHYITKQGNKMYTVQFSVNNKRYLIPKVLWEKQLIPKHILPQLFTKNISSSGYVNIKLPFYAKGRHGQVTHWQLFNLKTEFSKGNVVRVYLPKDYNEYLQKIEYFEYSFKKEIKGGKAYYNLVHYRLFGTRDKKRALDKETLVSWNITNVIAISKKQIDTKKPQFLWKFKTTFPEGLNELGSITSSPFIKQNTLYFSSFRGNIYALNISSRKLIWKIRPMHFIVKAQLAKDTLIYRGANYSRLYAYDLVKRKLKWKSKIKTSIHSNLYIKNDTVYLLTEKKYLYALDITNGKKKWRNKLSSPIGTVYAEGSKVFISSSDGYFYALNALNGKIIWKEKKNRSITIMLLLQQKELYILVQLMGIFMH